jgi:leucyl/phenylalanyl-tRNA--protein transferase
MTAIPWLNTESPFPSPRTFIQDDPELPDGLIAISESMDENRLLEAYRHGIFPWYSEGEPVLWWCTSPRMVLATDRINISQSLHKKLKQVLKQPAWEIKVDSAFLDVIAACAQSQRKNQDGTWITEDIINYYYALHKRGIAHSVETWHQGQLVGGLYGINLGKMFYGESMFRHVTDASKIALAALAAWCEQNQVEMIDCQQETAHLDSLGAAPISRDEFLAHLQVALNQTNIEIPWKFDKQILRHWL